MSNASPAKGTAEVFLNAVARYSGGTALREKYLGAWSEVTWEEYREHVEDFSLGLMSLGLQKGDKVCIHSEGTQEWLFADMAIQAAGGVTVGIYTTNPPAEVKYITSHSDAKIYIAQDQEQTDKILEVKGQLPKLEKIIVLDMRGLRYYRDPMIMSFKEVESIGRQIKRDKPNLFMERVRSVGPEDDALIIYTSGTTGPPKGVVHTHKSMLRGARAMVDFFDLNETDRLLSYLPLCHAAERLFSVYMPLFCGAVVNFAENTQTVQRDLVEISPTFFVAVPRILERMISSIKVKTDESTPLKKLVYGRFMDMGYAIADRKLKKKKLPTFWKVLEFIGYVSLFRKLQDNMGFLRTKTALCGAAAVAPEVLRFFHAIGVPFRQVYGQTEVLIVISHTPDDIKLETLGKNPFDGVDFKLGDQNEIFWRWEGIFKGYYKDEELTKQTIDHEGWVHSGDIGQLDEDGHLRLVDRIKNIIITSGGKNITPEYIENKIKASPYISDAIVIGEGKAYLTALIQINMEVMGKWAEDNRIPFTTLRDLSRNQATIDLVSGIVSKVNDQISRVEQVKKFRLIDTEIDHERGGELTATMKIKRNVVEKKFKELIDKMYGKGR